ncbi:prolyl hydroxylase family protein [Erythrobacter sp. R86502]|uniref:prolyl hydroxylase family protein n=1 Tax=Erythrobacter sp. R86502 TaxID=3093846 RepID=UPI0036D229C5
MCFGHLDDGRRVATFTLMRTPSPDQDALARLGAHVRARMADNPAIARLCDRPLELFAMADFLSHSECTRLRDMIDATAQPSALHEVDYASGFRTSYSADIDPGEPLVAAISARIDALLGVDAAIGEPVQGQRYHPGQQFKPHNDWFYVTEGYWPQEEARGGQRSWTAMAYLNTVEAGGRTAFTELGIEITPAPGVLLVWNNALPDGHPNEATLHAGLPVERGVKYIITKWYRTREWW